MGDYIISKGINSAILGSYTGNVKQFSLFYGIVIEDLEILAPESFKKESIFPSNTTYLPFLYSGLNSAKFLLPIQS